MARDLTKLPLNELARLAIEERMIESFVIAGGDVHVLQKDDQFTFNLEQGRIFLIGILLGRTWYTTSPDEPEKNSPGARLRTSDGDALRGGMHRGDGQVIPWMPLSAHHPHQA